MQLHIRRYAKNQVRLSRNELTPNPQQRLARSLIAGHFRGLHGAKAASMLQLIQQTTDLFAQTPASTNPR